MVTARFTFDATLKIHSWLLVSSGPVGVSKMPRWETTRVSCQESVHAKKQVRRRIKDLVKAKCFSPSELWLVTCSADLRSCGVVGVEKNKFRGQVARRAGDWRSPWHCVKGRNLKWSRVELEWTRWNWGVQNPESVGGSDWGAQSHRFIERVRQGVFGRMFAVDLLGKQLSQTLETRVLWWHLWCFRLPGIAPSTWKIEVVLDSVNIVSNLYTPIDSFLVFSWQGGIGAIGSKKSHTDAKSLLYVRSSDVESAGCMTDKCMSRLSTELLIWRSRKDLVMNLLALRQAASACWCVSPRCDCYSIFFVSGTWVPNCILDMLKMIAAGQIGARRH